MSLMSTLRTTAFVLALAGSAQAQSLGGITIGEPAPFAPVSAIPFANNFPDHDLLNFFPDACSVQFELGDGTKLTGYADGCDGPIMELQRSARNNLQPDSQIPEISTMLSSFVFGETTLADVTDLLGGPGTLVGNFGQLTDFPVHRLLYQVEGTDTFLVLWFNAPEWHSGEDITPEIYANATLGNIALVDPAFFSARYFKTDARVPQSRIEQTTVIFDRNP